MSVNLDEREVPARALEDQLTPAAAARLLGLSTLRVRQLIDAGILRGERTVLGRIITRTSVEAELRRRAALRGERQHD